MKQATDKTMSMLDKQESMSLSLKYPFVFCFFILICFFCSCTLPLSPPSPLPLSPPFLFGFLTGKDIPASGSSRWLPNILASFRLLMYSISPKKSRSKSPFPLFLPVFLPLPPSPLLPLPFSPSLPILNKKQERIVCVSFW